MFEHKLYSHLCVLYPEVLVVREDEGIAESEAAYEHLIPVRGP